MKPDPVVFFLISILVIASIMDILSSRIPNWLTFPALAAGISYFTMVKGYEGFLFSLAGAAAGFGLLILPFIIGGTGAGDLKLLGAVGSILGAQGVFAVFIFSSILGGIYALAALAAKGLLAATFRRYGIILKGFIITQQFVYIPPGIKEKEIKIKFGLAIALGTGSYLSFGFYT